MTYHSTTVAEARAHATEVIGHTAQHIDVSGVVAFKAILPAKVTQDWCGLGEFEVALDVVRKVGKV